MSDEYKLETITRQFKAVFFDLDGTLFNSEPLHATALVKAADQCKIDLTDIDPLHDFLGMPDPAVYRFLKASGRIPDNLSQSSFISAKNAHYLAYCRDLSVSEWDNILTAGTRELLKELKLANQLLAIVSASEPEIVEAMVKGAAIDIFFDHIVARGVCFRSKPSPGPYLTALRHWKLKSNDVLVFEDSPTGKKAAILAGCQVIAVTCFNEHKDNDLQSIDNFFGLF